MRRMYLERKRIKKKGGVEHVSQLYIHHGAVNGRFEGYMDQERSRKGSEFEHGVGERVISMHGKMSEVNGECRMTFSHADCTVLPTCRLHCAKIHIPHAVRGQKPYQHEPYRGRTAEDIMTRDKIEEDTHFQQTPSRNGSPSHVSIAQYGIGRRIQFRPAPAIWAISTSVYNQKRRRDQYMGLLDVKRMNGWCSVWRMAEGIRKWEYGGNLCM